MIIREWLFPNDFQFDQSISLSEETTIGINLNTFYKIVHEIQVRLLRFQGISKI
jgi:hypothetical protein